MATPICLLFLAAVAYVFARKARFGLLMPPFGDEAGHFLGAQAIHHGDRLYRDYIDAHGPVVFMLTHLWGVLHGFADLGSARLISVAAALIAALCLGAGAAFATWPARVVAVGGWLGMVAAFWLTQAFYLDDYFTIGAAALIVEFAFLALPMMRGREVSRRQAVLAGIAAPFACLSAYSFAPSSVLLLAPALLPTPGGRPIMPVLWGLAIGAAINLAWLLVFGDLVGMLVFHVLINQIDYARYIGLTREAALASLVPSLKPWLLVQSTAVVAFAIATIGWLAVARRRSACLFILAAVLLLDARFNPTFPDGAFVQVSFALFAALIAALSEVSWPAGLLTAVAGVTTCIVVSRSATISPFGLTRNQLITLAHVPLGRSNDPLSLRIRGLTLPSDRILVVPYNPTIYEWASRLPIAKYHAWLPWEADYARHPWFGRERNLCADFPREKPKVVVYDGWVVWNTYRPEDFMQCVLDDLHRDYHPDPQFPTVWIRNNPTSLH